MKGGSRASSVFVLCAFLMVSSVLVVQKGTVSAYSSHDPIIIQGDEDFTEENGVTGGSGTPSDPYLISGWEITVSTGMAVTVSDTSASFVLEDIRVNMEPHGDAMRIMDASSFAVENCLFEGSGNGIELFSCSDFSVTGNDLTFETDTDSGYIAIWVFDGTDFTLESNTITGAESYFGVMTSQDFAILRNEVPDDDLHIDLCRNGTITDNSLGRGLRLDCPPDFLRSVDISDNLLGGRPIVLVKNQDHASIYDCTVGQLIVVNCSAVDIDNVELSRYGNIEIQHSENVTISNCSINSAVTGILTEMCSNVTVARCLLQDCFSGVYLIGAENVTVERNLIDRCNESIRFGSYDAVIRQNMISNSRCAIGFESGVALIYSNSFNNITYAGLCCNPQIPYGHILWNTSYPLGGNYWSNYTGIDEFSGSEQDQEGADGIGDTPCSNEMGIDYYPLVESPDLEFGPASVPTSDGSILMWLAILCVVAAACIGVALVIRRKK